MLRAPAVLLALFIVPSIVPPVASAAAPGTMLYQGRLTDDAGDPVSIPASVTFRIFDLPTAGMLLWEDTYSVTPDGDGIFTQELGSGTNPLDDSVFDGTKRFLEIQLAGESPMQPRQLITSVAYAISAGSAAVAPNSIGSNEIIDGQVTVDDVSPEIVVSLEGVAPAAGNIDLVEGGGITITPGTNSITLSAAGGGSGTVTSVNAGAGLEATPANPITDSGTISVATGGITSPMIALNTIQGIDIADGAVGTGELAANAVNSSKIANGQVLAADIGPDQIDSNHIVSGAVGSQELQEQVTYGQVGGLSGSVQIIDNNNGPVVWLTTTTDDSGWFTLDNGNGDLAIWMSANNSGTDGYLWVYGDGVLRAGINGSNGEVFGLSKSFVVRDPTNPGRMIRYSSIEGPEAAMYARGTGTLVNGVATVQFPDHFEAMASPDGITVTLTPRDAASRGLAVVDVSPAGMEVAELENGSGNYEFFYMACATRKGFEDYKVYMTESEFRSAYGGSTPRAPGKDIERN